MYLSAQGSNSVEQAAHSFLATADVPLPNSSETAPRGLAQSSRWEALLSATASLHEDSTTQPDYGNVFMRTCALLALNRLKSSVIELDAALGGVDEESVPAGAVLPAPLLLLRAYAMDASAAEDKAEHSCRMLGEVITACWSVVDGVEPPPSTSCSTAACVRGLSRPAALAWGCKGTLLCSTLWMQAHQDACSEMAAGSAAPHGVAFHLCAATALQAAVVRVWDAPAGQLLQQWQGEHALPAFACAVAAASSLVRVYLHVGQLLAAASGQQLLLQLERAASGIAQAGEAGNHAAMQLLRAVVLSCDATLSLAQGSPAIGLAEAEEADTAALAAATAAEMDDTGAAAPPAGDTDTACRLADAQSLHMMAQSAVRSGCSCLCMVGSVLAGKAWGGMRAGNQLIASNAPAYMGMSKAICSNVTTMYDLTSTKTDAQFAREVLTQVASKYQLAQVLKGGWIKTI